jgi:hypothetical protein
MGQNHPRDGWSDPSAQISRYYFKNGLNFGSIQQLDGRWLASCAFRGSEWFHAMDEALGWVEKCAEEVAGAA